MLTCSQHNLSNLPGRVLVAGNPKEDDSVCVHRNGEGINYPSEKCICSNREIKLSGDGMGPPVE